MKNIIYLSVALILISCKAYSQWNEQILPGDINITLGIDFIDQNHGITGGWYGDISQQIYAKVYSTFNSGTEWIESLTPDSMRVMVDIHMINENLSYGAGAYNLSQMKTEPYHNEIQNPNINPIVKKKNEYLGMTFSRQENYRGYFVETTDGGLTWHPKGSFEDSVYYLVGISFIDQNKGFVVASAPGGLSHAILKTTDGGNDWYYVYPFEDNFWIEDIEFVDNLNGIAVGRPASGSGIGIILTTSDGGESWDKQFISDLSNIFSARYIDNNTVIIGGLNTLFESTVYKSVDGGLNWLEFHLYDASHFIDGVDAVQNSEILLVYGTYIVDPIAPIYIPFIDISLDGGESWSYNQLTRFQNYIPLYSRMVDEFKWYITGFIQYPLKGFVLYTDESGGVPVELTLFTAIYDNSNAHLNWTTGTELNNRGFEIERSTNKTDWRLIGFKEGNGTTTETHNYSFVDNLFGSSSPKLYYRLKQIDFDGSFEYSDIVEVDIAPSNFSLFQNYPNPFNPTTKIKFSIPQADNPLPGGARGGLVTLKVYDILGREVATLVNEEKQPGVYEVEFDASHLSSGIYYYQLKTGFYIETKKMIYLK